MSRTIGIRKDHQDPWKKAIIFVPSVGGNSNRREPEPSCSKPHAFDNTAKQSSGEVRAGVLDQLSSVQNKTAANVSSRFRSLPPPPPPLFFFPSISPVHLLPVKLYEYPHVQTHI